MPRINLTQKFVNTPNPPATDKKRIEHCDTQVPGLYLEVRDTSPTWGTFYLRYKNTAGKTCHTKIGRSTDMTLKQARTKAQQLRSDIQRGKDPQEEARQSKAVPTWDTFFEDSYLPHAQQTKRTWKNDLDMQRLRLSHRFGATPINRLQRQEIQQFHNELDQVKGFNTNVYFNYLRLGEEIGELGRELALLWGAEERLVAHGQPAAQARQIALRNRGQALESELADCMAYLLKLANYAGVDLESAYLEKMRENQGRSWH